MSMPVFSIPPAAQSFVDQIIPGLVTEFVAGRLEFLVKRFGSRRSAEAAYERVFAAMVEQNADALAEIDSHFVSVLMRSFLMQDRVLDYLVVQALDGTFPSQVELAQAFEERGHALNLALDPQVYARLITSLLSELRKVTEILAIKDEETFRQVLIAYTRPPELTAPVEPVTPEMLVPFENQSDRLVTGQMATVRHLRDGRFMERPKRLDGALEELRLLLANRDTGGDPEINTLWIHGRSGSGKSVLLLQLMAALVKQRKGPVYWLTNPGRELYELLRYWAEQYHYSSGQTAYIFVDDLYSPQHRDRIDFAAIGDLLRGVRYSEVIWPMLVTCGPNEQYEAFDTSDRYLANIKVRPWQLPPVDQQEREQLRQWFTDRTGQTPQTGPAFNEAEGLMVSMVLEMQQGDLQEFGNRFRDRLVDKGLLEVLAQPFALNRIYVYPPAEWFNELTPAEQDAFHDLNRDQDFQLDPSDSQGGEWRVTHPHISDAIYKAIRPSKSGIERSHDLIGALQRAFHDGNARFASRILKAVAEGGERIEQDLHGVTLAEGFIAALRGVLASPHLNQFSRAFFWTSLAVWHARDATIRRALDGLSPLDEARRALRAEHTYWVVLWRTLWALQPGNQALIGDAIQWLRFQDPNNATAWTYVWRHVLHQASKVTEDDLHALIQRGLLWLEGHEDRDAWSFIWEDLLTHQGMPPPETSVERLFLTGVNWLEGREDRDTWYFVWKKLVDNQAIFPEIIPQQRLLKAGLDWLQDREDRDPWTYVWQGLLAHRSDLPPETSVNRLIETGVAWLEGHKDHESWAYVWQKLLEYPEELPPGVTVASLVGVGVTWLEGYKDHESWVYLWQKLLEYPEELPPGVTVASLVGVGVTWLEGHERYESWAYLWQKLLEYPEELPPGVTVASLVRVGVTWLEGRGDHESWAFVWQKVLEYLDALLPSITVTELVQTAFFWLQGREDQDAWNYVWQKLLEFPEDLPPGITVTSLVEIGAAWLQGHERHSSWAFVWEKLLDHQELLPAGTSLTSLLGDAAFWLATYPENPSWSQIWEKVARLYRSSSATAPGEQLYRLAFTWLAAHQTDGGWPFIWSEVLSYRKERSDDALPLNEILRLGFGWLRGRETHPSWSFIYEELLRIARWKQSFLDYGVRWLQDNEDRPEVGGIAQLIVSQSRELTMETPVVVWANQWLETHCHNRSWSWLWGPLVDVLPPARSLDLIQTWLQTRTQRKASVNWVVNTALRMLPSARDVFDEWLGTHPDHPYAPLIRQHLGYPASEQELD